MTTVFTVVKVAACISVYRNNAGLGNGPGPPARIEIQIDCCW
jgi:hypothetical protein